MLAIQCNQTPQKTFFLYADEAQFFIISAHNRWGL